MNLCPGLRRRLPSLIAVAGAAVLAFIPTAAEAHTETDVVAVPADSTATVTLRPQHGCGGSPTINVAVRAPVAGSIAEDVEGWTASSTPDADGFTVLEWVGGVLPADEPGAFPVEFTVPDAVGELLVFPAVQGCEDGSELAWISGDPGTEFPAPRVLILAAGSEPAATIDDVPLDAPGRDQLTAVIDIDNPAATTTTAPATTTAPSTTSDTEPATTQPAGVATTDTADTEPATTQPAPAESAPTDTVPADSDDASSATPWIIGGILLVAAIAVAAVIVARRRR